MPRGAHRLSLLAPVAAHLRDRGIPFALIGAAAMAVHGVSRSTADIDLLALDRACLAPATWESLRRADLTAAIRTGDADDPLAGVVRFAAPGERGIDLVVGRASWQQGILDRAQEASLEGVRVPVATAPDLILLKLYAGGPQDAWDIAQLLAVPDGAALAAEIDVTVTALPQEARDLWARIRAGA